MVGHPAGYDLEQVSLWDDIRVKHTWAATPEEWDCLGHPPAGTTIDLRIALKSHQEDALVNALYEVSDPKASEFHALDRETDITLVLLAAPSHTGRLCAVASQAICRDLRLLESSDMTSIHSALAEVAAQHRASHSPSLLEQSEHTLLSFGKKVKRKQAMLKTRKSIGSGRRSGGGGGDDNGDDDFMPTKKAAAAKACKPIAPAGGGARARPKAATKVSDDKMNVDDDPLPPPPKKRAAAAAPPAKKVPLSVAAAPAKTRL
ncbi:hypothetical protein BGW80DRAFT_1466427 [Lactifluus volemus]|nr:hypothetical protein BGW80DRAFT_1466427 [Lactifluus volemus]